MLALRALQIHRTNSTRNLSCVRFILTHVRSAGKGSAAAPKRPAGKVVFPTTGNRLLDKQQQEKQKGSSATPAPPPAPPKEDAKEESNAFKAFTGKARSLKG